MQFMPNNFTKRPNIFFTHLKLNSYFVYHFCIASDPKTYIEQAYISRRLS
ncbi:hypothetical protein HanIR_Chr05g0240901 [Helianthus annuus]|nr:hypothetical protein HanIR_Chr05g0240901 [Helianthus annuus]